MKNFYFLMAAGSMALSPAHADTPHQFANLKIQGESHYLSAFWDSAQLQHAFVDVFSESIKTLIIDPSGSVSIVDGLEAAITGQAPSVSASANHPNVQPAQK